MTKTGWMFFRKIGNPWQVLGSYRLYTRKRDAEKYLPTCDQKKMGLTLEKVSVEITVLPTRRAK